MKYLLDTHVLLWSFFETARLSHSVKEIILNDQNDIFVSAISFWEISLKFSIGKLELENIQPEELPEYALKSGFEILDLDVGTMSSFYKLPRLKHLDSFDRMLIWQSINAEITIISKDKKFVEYLPYGAKVHWK